MARQSSWMVAPLSLTEDFELFFRPERRLNSARSFVLQVGHNTGPVLNAAFSARQLPLRFLELAFGVAHTSALDWIELSVNGRR